MGSPAYDFTVSTTAARSDPPQEQERRSTISKEVKGKVDLKTTPILEWT
jgi:hypothetical protein